MGIGIGKDWQGEEIDCSWNWNWIEGGFDLDFLGFCRIWRIWRIVWGLRGKSLEGLAGGWDFFWLFGWDMAIFGSGNT